ncbi:PolyA RNA polymerase GLD2 [Hondaea fermentalgiana]|uniref:PolyA RNA polymerase GLD2 n=1 Tax=Hondaea fermentalgiana TaxID=2315210 RepID=A0A2R5G6Q5_9STRA|nr:PolyA RNA polymerase GLD2 [Hondaea fermentalgiana]|eukprot:GBG26726.1 PolyA RNA polymerase GLD2 [Hondaea fermentalgiana]
MASKAAHEQLESGVFTRDTLHTLAQALPGPGSAGEADEEHGDIDSARVRDVDEEADEDLANDDDDEDEEDEDVGADEDENENDDVLRDAQNDQDDESDGGETGLDGLAQSALEMLTEKEGKESADEWGRHRAFDGATPDDAQMSPEVHAFLQSLPRLPDIRGVSLPKKLMIFFSALEDFYELAPDPMLDMEAHGMAARTFAGAISGIVAARVDYKLRNVIARIVDFICQALISAHKDLSNPNLLGSLTYLELWLRGLDRRNQLAAVFPPFKESLAKINSNIQRLRREQNEEKNAAKANQDMSQTAVSPAILSQLSAAMADLVLALQPTPEDLERRDTVIADMRVALSPESLQRALESVRDDVPAGLLSDIEQGTPVGVEIFGSAASGLNFRASADIDFSLISVAERLANFQGDQRGAAVAEERTHSRAIAIAALALSASPQFAIQDVILTSRVPIVKCIHIASGLACDVASGNSIALQNTQLLRAYSEVDPRARSLIYAVKFWAKRRGICDASLGTLSSYAWTLMVIFFLQQTRDRHPTGKSKRSRKANNKQASSRREKRRGHVDSESTKDDESTGNDGNDGNDVDGSDGAVADEHSEPLLDVVYRAVLPNLQAPALLSKVPKKLVMMNGEEYDATFVRTAPPDFPVDANAQSLGELLVQFFAFYAYEFNMRRDVVSVRLGFPARRGTLGGPYSQADWRLAIEDPFERQHDLGSKISSKDAMTKIHEELARAAQMFRTAQGISLVDAEVMQAPVQMPAFPRRCFNCGSAQHRSSKCSIGDLRSLGDKVCASADKSHDTISDGKVADKGNNKRKNKKKKPTSAETGGEKKGGGASQRVCRDWIAGDCSYGSRCKFYHPEKDHHPPGF